jgi:hypothetical protein
MKQLCDQALAALTPPKHAEHSSLSAICMWSPAASFLFPRSHAPNGLHLRQRGAPLSSAHSPLAPRRLSPRRRCPRAGLRSLARGASPNASARWPLAADVLRLRCVGRCGVSSFFLFGLAVLPPFVLPWGAGCLLRVSSAGVVVRSALGGFGV